MTDAEKEPVRLEIVDGVALLLIDSPPVNATSQAVRAGILQSILSAQADPRVEAVVIACEGRTFIAGGDIREFGKPPLEPQLPHVCNSIEALTKPVVAAVHGTALGGGFEIALSCHARVIDKKARIGLPEVKLGLAPGAGGTQRLPRIAGMLWALDVITSGRQVSAEEALRIGVVDRLAQENLREEAKLLARSLVGKPLRRTGVLPVPAVDKDALRVAVEAVKHEARGQSSPVKAAEMTLAAAELPLEEGMRRERALFFDLTKDVQSKALRYAFFAERELLRVPGLDGVKSRALESVSVIGDDETIAELALMLEASDLPVTLVASEPAAEVKLRSCVQEIRGRAQASGALSPLVSPMVSALLGSQLSFEASQAAIEQADLVICVIGGDRKAGQDMFGRVGRLAKRGAVLAIGTAFADVDQLAVASGRPGDVIGVHLPGPVTPGRLIEIVRHAGSEPTAVATGIALARRIGRLPIVCRACDGLVVGRLSSAYRRQAEAMVKDGARPQVIDAAMLEFGFPQGPFAALQAPGPGRADPSADRADAGAERRGPGDELIRQRLRAALIEEGALLLGDGIVARALDIDMAMIHGLGYPAWRGGAMFEADEIGLAKVLPDVEEMLAATGGGGEPAPPLLAELAAGGKRFSDVGRSA